MKTVLLNVPTPFQAAQITGIEVSEPNATSISVTIPGLKIFGVDGSGVAIVATLDDDTSVIIDAGVLVGVGDWRITATGGEVSFMADAAFQAASVSTASAV